MQSPWIPFNYSNISQSPYNYELLIGLQRQEDVLLIKSKSFPNSKKISNALVSQENILRGSSLLKIPTVYTL